MVYGAIQDYTGQKLSDATISLYDPQSYSILETIPVDDLGEYLFTFEKGKNVGIMIQKQGYFPYYHQLKLTGDQENEYEYNLHLPDGIRKEYSVIYAPESPYPGNIYLVEELISLLISQSGLSMWMPAQENPLGRSRIDFLDSLFQSRGIEQYRIISGSLPGNTDQIVQMNFQTDPDAQVPNPKDFSSSQGLMGENDRWTLQFSASKKKLSKSDLRSLDNTREFKGTDGYYRYTYGSFATRQEANQAISYLQSKGFSQAFPKRIGDLIKL